jgi:hypothetical protein
MKEENKRVFGALCLKVTDLRNRQENPRVDRAALPRKAEQNQKGENPEPNRKPPEPVPRTDPNP